jgi:hypothetical protein
MCLGAALLVLPAGAGTAPPAMSGFAPSMHAKPPSNVFEGVLTLGTNKPGGFSVIKDQLGYVQIFGSSASQLPPFSFAFVQSGDALIPIQRGAIASTHPLWEFVLEPGKVWDEPGEKGFTRASLPFALEERNENCMHNGMLTFRFMANGKISDVKYEIAAETCAYFQFNLWGAMTATYAPGAVAGDAQAISNYQTEIATQLPTRPIAKLAKKYPSIDVSQFGSPNEVNPADMTLYGVVVHGTNYVGGCQTRAGAYPACDYLDSPSYSLAKSIFASIMAMRTAKLHTGAMNEKIATYVPECATAGNWGDVTFANTLDLATGNYNSSLYESDENSSDMSAFLAPETHAAKIAFTCGHYPRKSTPGTLWVYHTADTYTLGTALRGYYAAKGGTGDFYQDLLVGPLWQPLHLHPALAVTRRTRDDVAQPFAGYGLTLLRDDIAKLSAFLGPQNGKIGGKQMLDKTLLDGAMQRDPNDTGLIAGSSDFRYNNGFWAWNAQTTLACPTPVWIPMMLGYGGIVVALMPNDVTYYYVSDGNAFAWGRAVKEADKIKPLCTH